MFTAHTRFKRKWFGKYLDEGRQNITIYTRSSYLVAATIMKSNILRMTRMGETRNTYKNFKVKSLVKRPIVRSLMMWMDSIKMNVTYFFVFVIQKWHVLSCYLEQTTFLSWYSAVNSRTDNHIRHRTKQCIYFSAPKTCFIAAHCVSTAGILVFTLYINIGCSEKETRRKQDSFLGGWYYTFIHLN